MCFLLAPFSVGQRVVSCPDLGHIVHISGVQLLLLVLEDGEPARLHCAALVHSTLDAHVPRHVGVGVASNGLSEVSAKEGDHQHRPEVRQQSAVPIVVICYNP